MTNNKKKLITILLVVLLIIFAIVSLCIGKYEVGPIDSLKALFNSNIDRMTRNVVIGLRLPRIIAAIIVGAVLQCLELHIKDYLKTSCII